MAVIVDYEKVTGLNETSPGIKQRYDDALVLATGLQEYAEGEEAAIQTDNITVTGGVSESVTLDGKYIQPTYEICSTRFGMEYVSVGYRRLNEGVSENQTSAEAAVVLIKYFDGQYAIVSGKIKNAQHTLAEPLDYDKTLALWSNISTVITNYLTLKKKNADTWSHLPKAE